MNEDTARNVVRYIDSYAVDAIGMWVADQLAKAYICLETAEGHTVPRLQGQITALKTLKNIRRDAEAVLTKDK